MDKNGVRPVPRARRRALRQQTRLRCLPARRGAGLRGVVPAARPIRADAPDVGKKKI